MVEVVSAHNVRTVSLVFPRMKGLIDLAPVDQHTCFGNFWLLGRVIEWTVAQEALKLGSGSFFLVHVHLVLLVDLVKLLSKHGTVKMDSVLVLGLRDESSINVPIVRELIDVVLIVVGVAASVEAHLLCILLLLLFLSFASVLRTKLLEFSRLVEFLELVFGQSDVDEVVSNSAFALQNLLKKRRQILIRLEDEHDVAREGLKLRIKTYCML